MGNDGKDSGQEKGGYISIHVPSWGTTMEKPLSYPNQQISIHVPSWGTTEGQAETCPFVIYFNPRSLVGNDFRVRCNRHYSRHFNPRSLVGNDVNQGGAVNRILISIHVPSWGTTNVSPVTTPMA